MKQFARFRSSAFALAMLMLLECLTLTAANAYSIWKPLPQWVWLPHMEIPEKEYEYPKEILNLQLLATRLDLKRAEAPEFAYKHKAMNKIKTVYCGRSFRFEDQTFSLLDELALRDLAELGRWDIPASSQEFAMVMRGCARYRFEFNRGDSVPAYLDIEAIEIARNEAGLVVRIELFSDYAILWEDKRFAYHLVVGDGENLFLFPALNTVLDMPSDIIININARTYTDMTQIKGYLQKRMHSRRMIYTIDTVALGLSTDNPLYIDVITGYCKGSLFERPTCFLNLDKITQSIVLVLGEGVALDNLDK